MRISGHKLKRAMADLSAAHLAKASSQLGFTLTTNQAAQLAAFPESELPEWQATILAAVCGAALSSLSIEPPRLVDTMARDIAAVREQAEQTGRHIEWLRMAVYYLSRQTLSRPLPLEAQPSDAHYFLHTPALPGVGCKECADNYGGPG